METIPFHKPFIGKEEQEAVLRVLNSGWLTTGKEALSFEKEFCQFLLENGSFQKPADKKELFCLAVNSATSGLHLALEALDIGPEDAVLLPSYTFTACAETIRYLGAEAVFVDIGEDSYNINACELEKAITAYNNNNPRHKLKAIIAVHFGGLPCEMTEINSIAKSYNLAVIEDTAHAFPAETQQGWAGTLGDIGVFSFYATKTITTGEGGMVVTWNKELARRISLMRNHGIDRTVWNRYTDTQASWYYEVIAPGFKYNMPDIAAALGRVQLGRALDLHAMRLSIAQGYDRAFKDSSVIIPPSPGGARHLYTIRLKEIERRDAFIESLRKLGIGASVHFIPLHIMPYYRERYGLKPEDFPVSLQRYKETVSLPLWPGMSNEQIDRVIEAVLLLK